MSVYPRNTLRTEHNRNGHMFMVIQNWLVTIKKYGDDFVKLGFWTDYASIPKLLWWWYDPLDYREEGALHDWLYKEQKWNGKKLTRKQADQVLYDFVERVHGKITARNFYYAVRMGGKKTWNKYKKKLK